MTYRITGLDPALFQPLYGLPDADLAARGVVRHRVDTHPGFPDRIELRDLEPGETALLLNFLHQPADTPYRASHAIFVREGATTSAVLTGTIPPPLRFRPISLRAFTEAGDMLDADLAESPALEPAILRLLAHPGVAYLHAHYARRGCYAARIDRAEPLTG